MLLERFLNASVAASDWLDRRLPPHLTTDGNRDFQQRFVPRYLANDLVIYDIGGGKQPFLNPSTKAKIAARVIGLDISAEELNAAPRGSYDDIVVSDIRKFRGGGDADLVICQALLEHVPDVRQALQAIASIMKPGGRALLFVPCRNAPFAVLNRALPHELKRKLLFTAFPRARGTQGFRSYYNQCTPKRIKELAAANELTTIELKTYYMSGYFRVFFPAQLIWRMWTILAGAIDRESLCETFSIALKKSGSQGS
jgi:SAM-dependent methyltransferase